MNAHPVAELFPPLSDEELKELAEDITANGLLNDIVLDGQGRIIDGRNRFRACEIAGVEPSFMTWVGDDPTAFIIAQNILRRHLDKGQRAALTVKAGLLETNSQGQAARVAHVSQPRIAEAAVLAEHAPEMLDAVVDGSARFDDAVRVARGRKQETEATERYPKLAEVDATPAGKLAMAAALDAIAEEARPAALAALDTAWVVASSDARDALIGCIKVSVPKDISAHVSRLKVDSHRAAVLRHVEGARKRLDLIEEVLST